jgi:hypothetical protein
VILPKHPDIGREMGLKFLGYWKARDNPNLPDPLDFVDPKWRGLEREVVVAYVEERAAVEALPGEPWTRHHPNWKVKLRGWWYRRVSASCGAVVFSLRHRLRRREPQNRARWIPREDLRPDVAEAYERGVMSNEQMTELLRAGGWKARRNESGKIVIDD